MSSKGKSPLKKSNAGAGKIYDGLTDYMNGVGPMPSFLVGMAVSRQAGTEYDDETYAKLGKHVVSELGGDAW